VLYKLVLTYLLVTLYEGDEEKLLSVRLLRGYIELIGPHIRTLLHSDVHLRRLSSALMHVLQFDCSPIQIIEERTTGTSSSSSGMLVAFLIVVLVTAAAAAVIFVRLG